MFLFIYFVQGFSERIIVIGTAYGQRHVSSNQRQVTVPFLDNWVLFLEIMIVIYLEHICLLRLKALDLQICIAEGIEFFNFESIHFFLHIIDSFGVFLICFCGVLKIHILLMDITLLEVLALTIRVFSHLKFLFLLFYR